MIFSVQIMANIYQMNSFLRKNTNLLWFNMEKKTETVVDNFYSSLNTKNKILILLFFPNINDCVAMQFAQVFHVIIRLDVYLAIGNVTVMSIVWIKVTNQIVKNVATTPSTVAKIVVWARNMFVMAK